MVSPGLGTSVGAVGEWQLNEQVSIAILCSTFLGNGAVVCTECQCPMLQASRCHGWCGFCFINDVLERLVVQVDDEFATKQYWWNIFTW